MSCRQQSAQQRVTISSWAQLNAQVGSTAGQPGTDAGATHRVRLGMWHVLAGNHRLKQTAQLIVLDCLGAVGTTGSVCEWRRLQPGAGMLAGESCTQPHLVHYILLPSRGHCDETPVPTAASKHM
jgi:hypothetical protein